MCGDGLMFAASEASARVGKASWILQYRFGGRQKVLGRYPRSRCGLPASWRCPARFKRTTQPHSP